MEFRPIKTLKVEEGVRVEISPDFCLTAEEAKKVLEMSFKDFINFLREKILKKKSEEIL